MTFQAYIDTIKSKTGKTPEEFRDLAEQKGLLKPNVKTSQIVEWLNKDFGLGRGHAMALVVTFNAVTNPKISHEEAITRHFSGKKERWRPAFDQLVSKVDSFGPGVSVKAGNTYLSLLKNGKKFAIVQVTADRLDVGIKLKSEKSTDRFKDSGSWNSMVTHRVQLFEPEEIDSDVFSWLRKAYERA